MKRQTAWLIVALVAAVAMPALRADVSTEERSTVKFEGLFGGILNRFSGSANGDSTRVSLKGNRLARTGKDTGEIIDLDEERLYRLDLRRRRYSVQTFEELRQQMAEAREALSKQTADLSEADRQQMADAGEQLEVDVDVTETGETRRLADYDTREVVLTLTLRQRDQTLEEGGGVVMTSHLWLAPRIAALDELMAFNLRFFEAVFGEMVSGADLQQMNALSALLPGISQLGERMAEEGRKLDGTALLTTTTFESVKSEEQMRAAEQPASRGGGGLGGMLARRVMGNRGQAQARSTVMTSTQETLSIGTTVGEDAVAIPEGFRLNN